MTIRELFREFVSAKQRREDQHDRDVSLAWRIEYMARQKKLPRLDSLLTARKGPQVQTPEQQRSVLEILSAQYGGALRPRTKG